MVKGRDEGAMVLRCHKEALHSYKYLTHNIFSAHHLGATFVLHLSLLSE